MSQITTSVSGSGPGGFIQTLTGNTGPAQSPTGGNIDVLTANSTVVFNGTVSTLTLDFGLRNLFMGVSPALTTGDENVAIGFNSGLSVTSAIGNVLIGFDAGTNLIDGNLNVAVGDGALSQASNNIDQNTAIGANALQDLGSNQVDNTALGYDALTDLTAGSGNIGIGSGSGLAYNGAESLNIVIGNPGVNGESGVTRIGTNGDQTTCFIAGIDAVDLSTANVVTEASDQLGTAVLTAGTGITITPGVGVITIAATTGGVTSVAGNTGGPQTGAISIITANSTPIFAGAAGTITLDFNLTDNLLLGSSGASITTGNTNIGMGKLAAASLTSGASNCFLGYESGVTYTTGSNSTAVGAFSMFNSIAGASNNTAIGYSSLYNLAGAGTNNTCLGLNSATAYTTTESNNIVIGSTGVITDNNRIRIGTNGTHNTCFITGIDGVNVGSVAKVVTEASDQLGTATITAGTGISVSAGANTITISTTGTTTLTVTTVNNAASPYTVLSTDEFLAVNTSGGAVTIRLPNAPATGRVYYIKDSNGTAAASNITVTTVGGAVNIDGATSFVMNTAYESISVIFDGSAYEVF